MIDGLIKMYTCKDCYAYTQYPLAKIGDKMLVQAMCMAFQPLPENGICDHFIFHEDKII